MSPEINHVSFDAITIECDAGIFSKKNDYSRFGCVQNCFGIYLFIKKSTDEVLYVGQATEQCLKDRITQHLSKNDSGGTFRINYCKSKDLDYEGFVKIFDDMSVKCIILNIKSKSLITAMESILISALNPEFNRLT